MSVDANAESGRLRLLCRKTELCQFYQRGSCTRGEACNFAHEAEDVRNKPDLRNTKPCPSLMSKGICQDPGCPFAHRSGELRKYHPSVRSANKSAPESRAGSKSSCFVEHDLGLRSASKSSSKVGDTKIVSKKSPGSTVVSAEDGVSNMSQSECSDPAEMDFDRQTSPFAESGFSRQTSAVTESGFNRQTSTMTDLSFSRQTTGCSENEVNQCGSQNKKLFKTRLCSFFMMGKCKKEGCTFAHGAHELRSNSKAEPAPPPAQPSCPKMRRPSPLEVGMLCPAAGATNGTQETAPMTAKARVPASPLPRAAASLDAGAPSAHSLPQLQALPTKTVGFDPSKFESFKTDVTTSMDVVTEKSLSDEEVDGSCSPPTPPRRQRLSSRSVTSGEVIVKNTLITVKDDGDREDNDKEGSPISRAKSDGGSLAKCDDLLDAPDWLSEGPAGHCVKARSAKTFDLSKFESATSCVTTSTDVPRDAVVCPSFSDTEMECPMSPVNSHRRRTSRSMTNREVIVKNTFITVMDDDSENEDDDEETRRRSQSCPPEW